MDTTKNNKKIGIALSGGVDSTATALLLKKAYGVENLYGFFMRLAQHDFNQQLARVQTITERIGIPLRVIDLREPFEEKVLDYFTQSYFIGKTPNPCVICNTKIKFGLFLDAILQSGVSHAASGHYARIAYNKEKDLYQLFMGNDRKKDQSYFLSRLGQAQLKKLLFPLASFNKEQIYTIVEKEGFDDFRGKESQDVCFLERGKITSFLSSYKKDDMRTQEGTICTNNGEKIGRHNGIFNYTIGQRKGLGISYQEPLYVTSLNAENNCVYVGPEQELFKTTITVRDIHWISDIPPNLSQPLLVRIRSTHKGVLASISLNKGKTATAQINFTEPQRAVTPGQFAVFYRDKELLGSAIIE